MQIVTNDYANNNIGLKNKSEYFYKCFKEHYGVSPARFRAREKI